MSTTFENARKGDKVWSFTHGWGIVQRDFNKTFNQMEVLFDPYVEPFTGKMCSGTRTFNDEGVHIPYEQRRTLFWDEIVFELPDNPKR